MASSWNRGTMSATFGYFIPGNGGGYLGGRPNDVMNVTVSGHQTFTVGQMILNNSIVVMNTSWSTPPQRNTNTVSVAPQQQGPPPVPHPLFVPQAMAPPDYHYQTDDSGDDGSDYDDDNDQDQNLAIESFESEKIKPKRRGKKVRKSRRKFKNLNKNKKAKSVKKKKKNTTETTMTNTDSSVALNTTATDTLGHSDGCQ